MFIESEPTVLTDGLTLETGERRTGGTLVQVADALHSPTGPAAFLDVLIVGGSLVWSQPASAAVLGAGTFLLVGLLSGLYRPRTSLETQGAWWFARAAVPSAVSACAALALVAHAETRPLPWPAAVAAALAVIGARLVGWLIIGVARRRGLGLRSAVLVGPPDDIDQVARRISIYPDAGLSVVAGMAPSPGHQTGALGGDTRWLAEEDRKRALDLIDRGEVDDVLICAGAGTNADIEELLRRAEGTSAYFSIVLPRFGSAQSAARVRLGDLRIVSLGAVDFSGLHMPGKRVFDVVLGVLLLVLLTPVLLAAAVAVYFQDRGPVFYRQVRVGWRGEPFSVWKFRSMVVGADQMTAIRAEGNVSDGLLFKMRTDPRVTRVGALLRRFSIDEMPQLLNVVCGHMSLVGPRPLPVDPAEFDEVAWRRHAVRPGITGPWQVSGANALTYDDMVSLDLAYISRWSLIDDIRLLVRTLPAILIRRAPC